MSTGRYCDVQIAPDCPSRAPYNGVFSELENDWDTFTGSRMGRDPVTGRRTSQEVSQDSCPPCTAMRDHRYRADREQATQPAAIPAGKKTVDAEEYDKYMKYLEEQSFPAGATPGT